jgi:2-phospho-L-lactate guanylyltransferase (CobY/MobA/RfbA family)
MILIPIKGLANAKQRLASLLDQPTRTELAQAMLFDVLEALGTWASRPEVGVVTSDPFAIELARQFDFQIIPDNANRSETDAIENGNPVLRVSSRRQHAGHSWRRSTDPGSGARANSGGRACRGLCTRSSR